VQEFRFKQKGSPMIGKLPVGSSQRPPRSFILPLLLPSEFLEPVDIRLHSLCVLRVLSPPRPPLCSQVLFCPPHQHSRALPALFPSSCHDAILISQLLLDAHLDLVIQVQAHASLAADGGRFFGFAACDLRLRVHYSGLMPRASRRLRLAVPERELEVDGTGFRVGVECRGQSPTQTCNTCKMDQTSDPLLSPATWTSSPSGQPASSSASSLSCCCCFYHRHFLYRCCFLRCSSAIHPFPFGFYPLATTTGRHAHTLSYCRTVLQLPSRSMLEEEDDKKKKEKEKKCPSMWHSFHVLCHSSSPCRHHRCFLSEHHFLAAFSRQAGDGFPCRQSPHPICVRMPSPPLSFRSSLTLMSKAMKPCCCC
jgi:hypothetical protein